MVNKYFPFLLWATNFFPISPQALSCSFLLEQFVDIYHISYDHTNKETIVWFVQIAHLISAISARSKLNTNFRDSR